MTVNQRIKVELEERGISQYQVAKVTNIGQSTISKWFKEVPTTPSPASVKKVAKMLGMKVSELTGEEIEKDPQTQELREGWNRLNREEKNCVLHVINTIVKHR